MIYALPFVPPKDVVSVYEKVITPIVEKSKRKWTSDVYDDDFRNEVIAFLNKIENS